MGCKAVIKQGTLDISCLFIKDRYYLKTIYELEPPEITSKDKYHQIFDPRWINTLWYIFVERNRTVIAFP